MEDHSPANNGFVAISNVDDQFCQTRGDHYCKSWGRYTEFFLTNDRSMVASKLLGTYQEEMNLKLFFRHINPIWSMSAILKISTGATGIIVR